MLDLEGLLQPIEGPSSSGPDLKYSAEFAELERAVEGKPERQLGGAVLPGEPPDWKVVVEKSQALLKSSKDLRVATILVRALLEVDAFEGFADGLALVRHLVDKYWDTLHPQLDAEDDNDPTARVTAMGALTHRSMLQALRSAPLVTSRAFGAVSLRSIDAAAAPPPKTAPGKPAAAPAPNTQNTASIEATFHQAPLDALIQTGAAIARSVNEARTLSEGWAERLPAAGPDFTELGRLLAQANHVMKTRLEQRQPQEGSVAMADGAPGASAPATAPSSLADVRSREDVLRAMDAICEYYARHEPSSPVPLLVLRGRRLVTMSFVDILKEMLPESIQNLQKITGKTDA